MAYALFSKWFAVLIFRTHTHTHVHLQLVAAKSNALLPYFVVGVFALFLWVLQRKLSEAVATAQAQVVRQLANYAASKMPLQTACGNDCCNCCRCPDHFMLHKLRRQNKAKLARFRNLFMCYPPPSTHICRQNSVCLFEFGYLSCSTHTHTYGLPFRAHVLLCSSLSSLSFLLFFFLCQMAQHASWTCCCCCFLATMTSKVRFPL